MADGRRVSESPLGVYPAPIRPVDRRVRGQPICCGIGELRAPRHGPFNRLRIETPPPAQAGRAPSPARSVDRDCRDHVDPALPALAQKRPNICAKSIEKRPQQPTDGAPAAQLCRNAGETEIAVALVTGRAHRTVSGLIIQRMTGEDGGRIDLDRRPASIGQYSASRDAVEIPVLGFSPSQRREMTNAQSSAAQYRPTSCFIRGFRPQSVIDGHGVNDNTRAWRIGFDEGKQKSGGIAAAGNRDQQTRASLTIRAKSRSAASRGVGMEAPTGIRSAAASAAPRSLLFTGDLGKNRRTHSDQQRVTSLQRSHRPCQCCRARRAICRASSSISGALGRLP